MHFQETSRVKLKSILTCARKYLNVNVTLVTVKITKASISEEPNYTTFKEKDVNIFRANRMHKTLSECTQVFCNQVVTCSSGLINTIDLYSHIVTMFTAHWYINHVCASIPNLCLYQYFLEKYGLSHWDIIMEWTCAHMAKYEAMHSGMSCCTENSEEGGIVN